MKTIDLAEAERMLESATDAVANARKAIADGAFSSEALTAEGLARRVNFLAETEGAFKAIHFMVRVLSYAERTSDAEFDGAAEARSELMDVVLRGADDGWSGSTNDVRRAEFDGFRKQAAQLLKSF